MKFQRRDIPLHAPVTSLCWRGNQLIDWAGGNRVFDLDGRTSDRAVVWGYRFDAAVQSRSGRYSAIYERLGTKAVVLDRGKFVRELNRSFHCAGSYEYPIAFLTHPDGRDLIAHCPDEYNRLEIDDAETGKRLTERIDRIPQDFFHSRLAVSPDGGRLLSAGWWWHPLDVAAAWLISDALADGRVLDRPGQLDSIPGVEVNDAVFVDSDRLLLSSNLDSQDFSDKASAFRPGTLALFNLKTGAFESAVPIEETVGMMLSLDDNHAVGFYDNPKVFNLRTGKVVFRWPDLATGKRSGCIIDDREPFPTIALDALTKRFAVTSNDRITVIEMEK